MQSNDVGPAPEARLFASEHEPEMELVHLRPEEIEVRHNPRRATPTPELHRLARTIAQAGLLQPLAVSRDGDRYVLVAGERRLEACKLIRSERIPCVVRRDDDPALRRVRALAENVARASLHPMEEAAELVAITDELGLTLEEAAEAVGISAATARDRRLPLLELPRAVRAKVHRGEVGVESAMRLVRVTRSSPQLAGELAERLSTGALERKAFEADPAAAVAQLAAEEGEPETLCLPFSEGTRLDAGEAAGRIRSAAGDILDEPTRQKLGAASANAGGKLIEITVEDVVRAQGASALLTYRRGPGAVDFLVDPRFAGEWLAEALERAKSVGKGEESQRDPSDGDEARRERERREQEAKEARADNEILGNNLAVELDHLREVPKATAELLAGLLVEAYGAQMAQGARLARRGWWRREAKEMRSGGIRVVERPLEADEARARLEEHLAGAETGAQLVGRLASHLIAAVGCDQRALPPSQRRQVTLPYGGEGTVAGRMDKALAELAGKVLSKRRYDALCGELGLESLEPLRDRRSPRQRERAARERAAKDAVEQAASDAERPWRLFDREPRLGGDDGEGEDKNREEHDEPHQLDRADR